MAIVPASQHACDYCGLPVATPARRRARRVPPTEAATTERIYCCLGCRWAAAIQGNADDAPGSPRHATARLGLAIFFAMNVMTLTMALWTQDVYQESTAWGASWIAWQDLLRYGCLMFSAPVVVLLGFPLLEGAWQDLRARQLSVEQLIVVGVAASLAYSVLALARGGQHVYFEVACAVLVAISLGRWLEATAKRQTVDSLESLARWLPETARRALPPLAGDTAPETRSNTWSTVLRQWEEVPLDQIQAGDLIRVTAGERIPVDGRVERYRATVDEQWITGESEPVVKQAGDELHGGSLNLDGDLWVRVVSPASGGTWRRLIEAVQRAATTRGADQRLADRITAWFIPAVLVVAIATFGHRLRAHGAADAVMSSLAVLLIACPCALGIATPLAVWAALARGSKHQVLFRDADTVTRLARVRTICFDKTGTLTAGTSELSACWVADDENASAAVAMAGVIAGGSRHGMCQAIVKYARGADPPAARREEEVPDAARLALGDGSGWPGNTEVRTIPGRGLQTVWNNEPLYLGSPRWMDELAVTWPAELLARRDEAMSRATAVTCLARDGRVVALFAFRERLRPQSELAIQKLRALGIRLLVLTGDMSRRGEAVSCALGIAVEAGLLPEEKQRRVDELRREGLVAMVGDGINDAPALAAADVGVALGCGADLARDVAGVCLLRDDLDRLPWAIELARQTRRVIRLNLFWAFAYNIVGIALAAVGCLNPVLAAVAMVGSSLLVIVNSLRLARGDSDTVARVAESSVDKPRRTPAPRPAAAMAVESLARDALSSRT